MLTHKTDLSGDMLARLAAQLKQKPKLQALVQAHAAQYQALEDAFWTILDGRPFPVAVGDALTRWGAAVGQVRPATGAPSTDDTAYRPYVQGRIVANTSLGLAEDVLRLVQRLNASKARYADFAPVAILLEVQDDVDADDATLVQFLTAATGPVSLGLTIVDSHPFGFLGDPTAYGFDDGDLARTVL